MYQNLILDFSGAHSYLKEEVKTEKIAYIDCTDITEANMYCSETAEREIKRKIAKYGYRGIHFLDSGNYHYVTKFFLEQIKEPFSLVLFDYHDDMRHKALYEFSDCGSWARDILLNHPYLQQMIIIGPEQKQADALSNIEERLVCISIQELENEKAEKKLEKIKKNIPVYISIDKDVLSNSYAVTNWNQGRMSLEMLENVLTLFLLNDNVMGVDICGEYSLTDGTFRDFMNAEKVNKNANKELFHYIRSFIQ